MTHEKSDKKDSRFEISRLLSLLLLFAVLIAIPFTVVILGQRTRQQIKADVTCRQPVVPDPRDCVGGQWQLYEDLEGCSKFRCIPK